MHAEESGNVPEMEKESAHPPVLVVPVRDANTGVRLQKLPRWKAQQKILWAKVRKETRRGGPFQDQEEAGD